MATKHDQPPQSEATETPTRQTGVFIAEMEHDFGRAENIQTPEIAVTAGHVPVDSIDTFTPISSPARIYLSKLIEAGRKAYPPVTHNQNFITIYIKHPRGWSGTTLSKAQARDLYKLISGTRKGLSVPFKDLPQLLHHAIDIFSMRFDTHHTTETNIESIAKQAEAEARTHPPNLPAHPQPDTEAELEAIAAEANHLGHMLGELRDRDLPLTATEAETAIAGLHAIATRGLTTERQLGLHAVERGLISQNKLASLLGVSQMTVSKWYRGGLNNDEQQKRPRSRADSSS